MDGHWPVAPPCPRASTSQGTLGREAVGTSPSRASRQHARATVLRNGTEKNTLGQELKWISGVAIHSCAITSKPLCFPGPQFPHLSSGQKRADLSQAAVRGEIHKYVSIPKATATRLRDYLFQTNYLIASKAEAQRGHIAGPRPHSMPDPDQVTPPQPPFRGRKEPAPSIRSPPPPSRGNTPFPSFNNLHQAPWVLI